MTGTFLDRLAAADAAWQREKARSLWWRAVPWLLGFILAAFCADAFLQLGKEARIAWLVVCGLGTVCIAAFAWHTGWMRRNPAARVARHLEQRDPRLGSRLINTLQLAEQARETGLADDTRKLAADAVSRYGEEIAPVDLPALAPTGEDRRRRLHAGIAMLAFVLVLAMAYPIVRVVLPRFLDPLGDHPPYAFTRLEIVDPGEHGADVTYGASLPVRVAWAGHDPGDLFVSIYPRNGGPVTTLPMIRDGDKGFVQSIENVRGDLALVAHSQSFSFYSPRREARVILTPKIERAFLEITPPAYTGLKREERPFDFKSASALEGSELRFRLRSNRPLRKGTIEITRNGKAARVPLKPSAENEVAGSIRIDDDMTLRFRVTDIDGIESADLPEALVSMLHDLPPTVSMVAPAQDGFVCVDYKLKAKIEAGDDYGVKTLRIHRALNGVYSAPLAYSPPNIETIVEREAPLDFSDLGVHPGDRVSFFAEAVDTAPATHLARSQTVTLTMISREDYNAYIRQQNDVRDLSGKYEELLRQFHELRAAQLKLNDDLAQLSKAVTDGSSAAAHLADYDAATARQNEIDQRLDKLAGQMKQFVRPNPLYDFERDLQKQLTGEALQIQQSTGATQDTLGQLAKQTSHPDGSRSLTPADIAQLQAAAKAQVERLGAGGERMSNAVSKPLQDLSHFHDLVNDFNAFQQAYQEQQALAEQARAYENKGPLNREDQLALKSLAEKQDAVREVLAQLPSALRDDARAGESKFPKAASSARALADAIENGRFEPMASSATGKMLDGDGEQGGLLAERLESDMRKLFGHCNGSGQTDSSELDQYLRLTFGGEKNGSFDQMRQCMKFGSGAGEFPGLGFGRGQSPASGYSVSSQEQASVLGDENLPQKGPRQSSKLSGNGSQAAGEGALEQPAPHADAAEVLKGLNPADRKSAAVHAEGEMDEYGSIVDEYFKAITHQK